MTHPHRPLSTAVRQPHPPAASSAHAHSNIRDSPSSTSALPSLYSPSIAANAHSNIQNANARIPRAYQLSRAASAGTVAGVTGVGTSTDPDEDDLNPDHGLFENMNSDGEFDYSDDERRGKYGHGHRDGENGDGSPNGYHNTYDDDSTDEEGFDHDERENESGSGSEEEEDDGEGYFTGAPNPSPPSILNAANEIASRRPTQGNSLGGVPNANNASPAQGSREIRPEAGVPGAVSSNGVPIAGGSNDSPIPGAGAVPGASAMYHHHPQDPAGTSNNSATNLAAGIPGSAPGSTGLDGVSPIPPPPPTSYDIRASTYRRSSHAPRPPLVHQGSSSNNGYDNNNIQTPSPSTRYHAGGGQPLHRRRSRPNTADTPQEGTRAPSPSRALANGLAAMGAGASTGAAAAVDLNDAASDTFSISSFDRDRDIESRFEWQHILNNVLQGEVLRQEKTRLNTTLVTEAEDPASKKKWRALMIWLKVRAFVRGRGMDQEQKYLDEARQQVDDILQQVMDFKVMDEEEQAQAEAEAEAEAAAKANGDAQHEQERGGSQDNAAKANKGKGKAKARQQHSFPRIRLAPEAQVESILRKVEWCESLYPSSKTMGIEKPLYGEKDVQDRLAALRSWQTITERLKVQVGILQTLTGSRNLEVTNPVEERIGGIGPKGSPVASGTNSPPPPSPPVYAPEVEPHEGHEQGGQDIIVGESSAMATSTPIRPAPHPTSNGTSSSNTRSKAALIDASSYVERVLKEGGLQLIFEKGMLSVINNLNKVAKDTMIANSHFFAAMNLPIGFTDDLIALVNFPPAFMREALRLRLDYAQKIRNPSLVMIDQLTEDFRTGLTLANNTKRHFQEIASPELALGWALSIEPEANQAYDHILVESLKFFFRLLHWKLRTPNKAIIFKETEIVENEWRFLSEAVEQIDGGDLLVGKHFSNLTHRLMYHVIDYFDNQLRRVENKNWMVLELARWFGQVLDNVRARHRKLLRFGRTMTQRFENSAEYHLTGIDLNAFIGALSETDHFFVYTGQFEKAGIYIIGDPTLHDNPELVRQILTKCFSVTTQDDQRDTGEGEPPPIDPMHYVLLLTPREPFMWTGRVMNIEILAPEFGLKERRVRIVSDGPLGRLAKAKKHFLDLFPAFNNLTVVEAKAHLSLISKELKKIKRSGYELNETIMQSTDRVHSILRKTEGYEGVMANYFVFAADLGQRSIKHMDLGSRNRFLRMLMRFSIKWITFIIDDCHPSDPRTFKWAVAALEFATSLTRGDNILKLKVDEFTLLRSKVAGCMTLLISHFDILGARGRDAAKKEQERLDAAKQEARRQIEERMAEMNMPVSEQDQRTRLGSLHLVRERWMQELNAIDEGRMQAQQGSRLVGKVLDYKGEDGGLRILASSSSNISIKWQQGRFVGQGAFGSVYLAINLETTGLMAVKEIRFETTKETPKVLRQIRDEMTVMSRIRHTNIIEYYGIEVHRDRVYIFMEYCQGGSLANVLQHGGRIEDEIIIQVYCHQLLQGLMYLHDNNIIHRDIKPDNILLDSNGVLKFVDFGAAKIIAKNVRTMARSRAFKGIHRSLGRSSSSNGNSNSNNNSDDGDPDADPGNTLSRLIGTPQYMSPEIIRGENKGRHGAMDIWSLGCVLLEMATGRRPWANLDNEWAIMFHIGIQGRTPALPGRDELSEVGIGFLSRCLDPDPWTRPTARELSDHSWIEGMAEKLGDDLGHDGGLLDLDGTLSATSTLVSPSTEWVEDKSGTMSTTNGLSTLSEEIESMDPSETCVQIPHGSLSARDFAQS